MTSLCLRFTLATLVGASILFCAPQTTHAFNGHLFGRGPTVTYYVPQPAVPAVVAPTVAYSPVVTVPAKPVTAYCAPVPMTPAPAGVTAYYTPAPAPTATTACYAPAPANVVFYPAWTTRRKVSPIHGY